MYRPASAALPQARLAAVKEMAFSPTRSCASFALGYFMYMQMRQTSSRALGSTCSCNFPFQELGRRQKLTSRSAAGLKAHLWHLLGQVGEEGTSFPPVSALVAPWCGGYCWPCSHSWLLLHTEPSPGSLVNAPFIFCCSWHKLPLSQLHTVKLFI